MATLFVIIGIVSVGLASTTGTVDGPPTVTITGTSGKNNLLVIDTLTVTNGSTIKYIQVIVCPDGGGSGGTKKLTGPTPTGKPPSVTADFDFKGTKKRKWTAIVIVSFSNKKTKEGKVTASATGIEVTGNGGSTANVGTLTATGTSPAAGNLTVGASYAPPPGATGVWNYKNTLLYIAFPSPSQQTNQFKPNITTGNVLSATVSPLPAGTYGFYATCDVTHNGVSQGLLTSNIGSAKVP